MFTQKNLGLLMIDIQMMVCGLGEVPLILYNMITIFLIYEMPLLHALRKSEAI